MELWIEIAFFLIRLSLYGVYNSAALFFAVSWLCIYIKKKIPGLSRVCPGRPGSGSTHRVDRVLPSQLLGGFLLRPGPVLGPGLPGPGSAGSRVDPPGRSEFQNYGGTQSFQCWTKLNTSKVEGLKITSK